MFNDPENTCAFIAEHMSDGLLVVRNNRILFCNTPFAKMMDFSAEELRQLQLSDLFTEDITSLLERTEREHNTTIQFTTTLLGRNGIRASAEITIQPRGHSEPDSTLMIVRKKLPENRQENTPENRYRIFWELSPSGVILEDAEGTIIDVNPAFCRYMGYQPHELIGKPIHILAHPEKQSEVSRNIRDLLTGKVLRHHAKSVARDGSLRYMALHETKVTMPDGRPGILSIAADVTDQLRADEEKLRREKMQSVLEIAGAVCHELNQPMTVVSVNCDLILMNQFSKEEIFKKVEVVKKQLGRMTDITKKLMHLTKYETRDYLNGTRIVDLDRATGYKSSDPAEG